jgi:hypothetical protein
MTPSCCIRPSRSINALAGAWEAAHAAALLAVSFRNYGRVYVGFTRWHEIEALLRGGDAERAIEDTRHMPNQVAGSDVIISSNYAPGLCRPAGVVPLARLSSAWSRPVR